MSPHDAYDDEMGFLRRLTPEEEDRLIAGRAPERGELAEVASFVRVLRASVADRPIPTPPAGFIATLAETARVSAATQAAPVSTPARPTTRPRSRLALVARVAVAVATVPFLFAGLAFAGVSLPGPADDAFESIGVELPNQQPDDDTEGTAKDGDSAGSATGQENSSGKLGHGKTKDKQGKALGRDKAKRNQGKAIGKDGLAPGQTREKGGSGSANAGGSNPNAGGSNAGGSSSGSGGGGGSGKSSGGSGGASGGSQGGGPPAGKGPSK
jgi:hypothetical protein